jgi:hypothetical protein
VGDGAGGGDHRGTDEPGGNGVNEENVISEAGFQNWSSEST